MEAHLARCRAAELRERRGRARAGAIVVGLARYSL